MVLKDKTILVTGGTGFIGSRLTEKLIMQERAHVRVLVRNFTRAARISHLPVEMLPGDVADKAAIRKAVQGCDVVYHCAYDFGGTRQSQTRVGIQGTRNVCEAVLEADVPRLVHVSSFAVYAPMPDGQLTESSPWPKTANGYVLIKRASERLVLDLYRQESLPAVVIQPTLVYGPWSPHWTIAPAMSLKTGLVPLVNGGSGSCNLVYIDDVVEAMILAAARPGVVGETFLISAENPVTWKTFYSGLEAALGIHATVEMSEEQIRAEIRKSRQQPSVISRLLSIARHQDVYPQLVSLPIARHLLQGLRDSLSDERWEHLKSRLLQQGDNSKERRHIHTVKSLHLPDETVLALYLSKTTVCITKAKEQLGYCPRVDFAQGMYLTGCYLKWANLA